MTSKSGLVYVKDMSRSENTTLRGEVVNVGEGRLLADGRIIPLKIKTGDIVIFSKMQGESYTDGTDDYVIISESCILAKEIKE